MKLYSTHNEMVLSDVDAVDDGAMGWLSVTQSIHIIVGSYSNACVLFDKPFDGASCLS